MDKKVTDFIDAHRISVLTTLLPNNTPHSSTLHFAASTDPMYFIFLTEKSSRKCGHFEEGQKSSASLVIGFSEEEWVTLQMEGEIEIVGKDNLEEAWRIYSHKYRGSEKYKTNKENVLLKFTPNWWRYTKVRPKPPEIISSKEE